MIIIICMSLKKKLVVKQASSLGKGFVVVFTDIINLFLPTMYVHCVYSTMSKSYETLSDIKFTKNS
jgi:hypothetical protein